MQKTVIFSVAGVVIAGMLFFVLTNGGRFISNDVKNNNEPSIITIAVCPTFYRLGEALNEAQYKIVKTQSTLDSLALLQVGEVDYVLSGRVSMPNESMYGYEFIDRDHGLSFLTAETKSVYVNDLKNTDVYTDLPPEKIYQYLDVARIHEVHDVYEYLSDGIVITSWDNTDSVRASIIHVLNDDNTRFAPSRTPILYCVNACEHGVFKDAVSAYSRL